MLAARCKEFLGLCQVSRKDESPSGRAQGPERGWGPQEVTDLQSPGLVRSHECFGEGSPCCQVGAADPPDVVTDPSVSISIQACAGAQKGWSVLLQVGNLTDP